MNLSRWLSLIIVVIYAVSFLLVIFLDKNPDKNIEEDLYTFVTLLIFSGVPLALIWYGEELGDGLIGAKWGWINAPSPGWAIRLFGWLFLLIPAAMFILSLFKKG